MWRNSGILYLQYIFRTLKRVYKPTVVISTKLFKMSSFCQNMACGYRERAGFDLSNIYVNVFTDYEKMIDNLRLT